MLDVSNSHLPLRLCRLVSSSHLSCSLRRQDAGQLFRGLPLHFLSGGWGHEDSPLCGRFQSIFKTEEKGSDVNLGSHLLMDGFLGRYEAAIVITGDSDLVTPFRMVRTQLIKPVGVLNPQRLSGPNCRPVRQSAGLQQAAWFYQNGVSWNQLINAQFPSSLTISRVLFCEWIGTGGLAAAFVVGWVGGQPFPWLSGGSLGGHFFPKSTPCGGGVAGKGKCAQGCCIGGMFHAAGERKCGSCGHSEDGGGCCWPDQLTGSCEGEQGSGSKPARSSGAC